MKEEQEENPLKKLSRLLSEWSAKSDERGKAIELNVENVQFKKVKSLNFATGLYEEIEVPFGNFESKNGEKINLIV